jgi:hypothetical protein
MAFVHTRRGRRRPPVAKRHSNHVACTRLGKVPGLSSQKAGFSAERKFVLRRQRGHGSFPQYPKCREILAKCREGPGKPGQKL